MTRKLGLLRPNFLSAFRRTSATRASQKADRRERQQEGSRRRRRNPTEDDGSAQLGAQFDWDGHGSLGRPLEYEVAFGGSGSFALRATSDDTHASSDMD